MSIFCMSFPSRIILKQWSQTMPKMPCHSLISGGSSTSEKSILNDKRNRKRKKLMILEDCLCVNSSISRSVSMRNFTFYRKFYKRFILELFVILKMNIWYSFNQKVSITLRPIKSQYFFNSTLQKWRKKTYYINLFGRKTERVKGEAVNDCCLIINLSNVKSRSVSFKRN